MNVLQGLSSSTDGALAPQLAWAASRIGQFARYDAYTCERITVLYRPICLALTSNDCVSRYYGPLV